MYGASERGCSTSSAPTSQLLHRLSSLTLFVDLAIRGFASAVPMPPAQWLHSFDLFRSSTASATVSVALVPKALAEVRGGPGVGLGHEVWGGVPGGGSAWARHVGPVIILARSSLFICKGLGAWMP
jgi:hypothetical protein